MFPAKKEIVSRKFSRNFASICFAKKGILKKEIFFAKIHQKDKILRIQKRIFRENFRQKSLQKYFREMINVFREISLAFFVKRCVH